MNILLDFLVHDGKLIFSISSTKGNRSNYALHSKNNEYGLKKREKIG